MLEFKKNSLLDDIEYEDYDNNVAKLTDKEKEEFGLVKKSCCGSNGGCSKSKGVGSCCKKQR